MLQYSLVRNWLTDRPDDHSAQTRSMKSLDKEAIVTRMLNKNATFKRTDILAVLDCFEETVVETLIKGDSVNLPLFNTLFSISGVFENQKDSFDKNRHKLKINLTKGVLLRETEKYVRFEKTDANCPQPQILEVKDTVSKTVNEKLTPKGVVELRGHNLKIDGNDPSCGLWFVCSRGKEKGTESKAEILIENKPSKIIAMIPDLKSTNYRIKIVTQFTVGGRLLKNPKSFVYLKSLRVK